MTAAADVGALELFGQGGPWTGVVYLHASGEEERIALGRLEIARSLAEPGRGLSGCRCGAIVMMCRS